MRMSIEELWGKLDLDPYYSDVSNCQAAVQGIVAATGGNGAPLNRAAGKYAPGNSESGSIRLTCSLVMSNLVPAFRSKTSMESSSPSDLLDSPYGAVFINRDDLKKALRKLELPLPACFFPLDDANTLAKISSRKSATIELHARIVEAVRTEMERLHDSGEPINRSRAIDNLKNRGELRRLYPDYKGKNLCGRVRRMTDPDQVKRLGLSPLPD